MERYFDVSTNVYDCRCGCYNGCCYNAEDKDWPPCKSRAGDSCCPDKWCCEQWWCWCKKCSQKSAIALESSSHNDILPGAIVPFDIIASSISSDIKRIDTGGIMFSKAGSYQIHWALDVNEPTETVEKLAYMNDEVSLIQSESCVKRGKVTGTGIITVNESDLAKVYKLRNMSDEKIILDTAIDMPCMLDVFEI